jgi:dipeptidase E
MTRRIIAMGGGGFLMERCASMLDSFFVETAGVRRPRICFIPTGGGDPEEGLAKYYRAFSKFDCRLSHLAFFRKPRPGAIPLNEIEQRLLAHDAIYVGGGNTRSMLAVWREWGLDRALRKAWVSGILLGGMSAGAICWFEFGATDSVRGPGRSTALPCLGFLPGSCSPHFDGESHRREDFRRLILSGELPAGIGIDDGVAVLYENRKIKEIVSNKPGPTAYRASRNGRSVVLEALPARHLASKPNPTPHADARRASRKVQALGMRAGGRER